jgi:hypothetical protein
MPTDETEWDRSDCSHQAARVRIRHAIGDPIKAFSTMYQDNEFLTGRVVFYLDERVTVEFKFNNRQWTESIHVDDILMEGD